MIFRLFTFFALFLLLQISADDALSTTKVGSTITRFNQFISTLTTLLSDGATRAVHSSGGAAGGVVSEGQGYGLLIGGVTSASLSSSDASFSDVTTKTYQMFLGWKRMCTLSSGSASCQGSGQCTVGSTTYPCLPHWKFDDSITGAAGTGPAPDGDEDAITGMILLVFATQSAKPSWWNEVAKWAYQSCKQFYDSNVALSSDGQYAMLKLGACWGGWDCNNPSYHAPGAYRLMRNYVKLFAATFGSSTDATTYVANFNKLISTSYATVLADQCATTGLTTNWYVPSSNPSVTGTAGCSGSGTPQAQFGAEAARGVWRVALDYLWYPSEAGTSAATYLDRVTNQVCSKYTGSGFNDLSTGCLVTSVFSSWTDTSNAFICGPTFTALTKASSTVSSQQSVLDAAGSIISSGSISSYYAGSWIVISTFTLNGDLAKIATLVNSNSISTTLATTTVTTTTTTKTTSTPTVSSSPSPTATSTGSSGTSTGSYTCSYAYNDQWYIEIYLSPSPPDATMTFVECSDGRQISCSWRSDWGKWQCNANGVACNAPRSVVVKNPSAKGCCTLGRDCSIASYAEGEAVASTSTQTLPAGAVAGIIIGAIIVVGLIVFVVYHFKKGAPVSETY